MIKSIYGKYKLYKTIDLYGFAFYWLGIIFLLLSYPVHYCMEILIEDSSFIDRVASLALVFFLVSEFRLTNKINTYILTSIEKNTDIKVKALIGRVDLNTKSIDTILSLLTNIILQLQLKKTDKTEQKQKLASLAENMANLKGNVASKIEGDVKEKLLSDVIIEETNFIQTSILILIAISTALWGFGSLI